MSWYKIFSISGSVAILKFLSSFILIGLFSRVVEPVEYAVVPLSIAVFYFCDAVCESGVCGFFNQYEVSVKTKREIIKKQLKIAVILFFISIAIGLMVEILNEIEGQCIYIFLTSIIFLLSPSYYVKLGELRRSRFYGLIAFIDIVTLVVYVCSFIMFLYSGLGVYTLVLSQLLMAFVRFFIISYLAKKYVIVGDEELFLSLNDASNIIKLAYRSGLNRGVSTGFETYLLIFILSNSNYSLISQGKKISQIPSDFFSAMFSSPLQSYLKSNPSRAIYIPTVYLFVGLFVMFVIGFLAELIIEIYLGEKWFGVVGYLKYYLVLTPLLFLNILFTPYKFSKGLFTDVYKMSKVNLIWTISTVVLTVLYCGFNGYEYIHVFPFLYVLLTVYVLRSFYSGLQLKFFYLNVSILFIGIYLYFIFLLEF